MMSTAHIFCSFKKTFLKFINSPTIQKVRKIEGKITLMRTQETNSPGVQFGGQVVIGVGPACRDSPLSSASPLAGLWASFSSSPDHNISQPYMALN